MTFDTQLKIAVIVRCAPTFALLEKLIKISKSCSTSFTSQGMSMTNTSPVVVPTKAAKVTFYKHRSMKIIADS